MNIAILSRNEDLYSTRRLMEVANERGHDVSVIDYARCYMNITSESPSVHYKGTELMPFDAIIPRISPKRTFYGTAVVRQFETMVSLASTLRSPLLALATNCAHYNCCHAKALACLSRVLPVTQ